ncbi:MAG: hypothetical protein AB1529_05365 [Candidatus Micrarchaeota archaeon]
MSALKVPLQPGSGPVSGRFPAIERESATGRRTITVFGFMHGHGGEFKKYGGDAANAIDAAVSQFAPLDYILAEGYETELAEGALAKKTGKAERLGIRDYIAESLIDDRPRLRFCERFEWHSIFPWDEAEQVLIDAEARGRAQGSAIDLTDAIRLAYAPEETERMLADFFQCTWIDRMTVEEMKRIETESLRRVSGLPEGAVRQYVEKRTTFKSLLAARTAHWRAELLDTRLFVGVLHAAEAAEFLANPGAAADYADSLPEGLRAIYDTNEAYQRLITKQCLGRAEQAVSMKFLPLYLRWLAYKVYEYEYGIGSGVDYSEYRKMLADVLRNMGRDESCACFSGEKFGMCCESLLQLLESERAVRI